MGKQQEQMPQVPQLDPAIQPMANKQLESANEYTANAGNVKKQQGDIAKQGVTQQLAGENNQITKNASSRGLLYSGLKQGAQAKAQTGAAGDLSQKQGNINNAVDQQAESLQNNALQSQMGVQNLTNQRNALAYNIAQNK